MTKYAVLFLDNGANISDSFLMFFEADDQAHAIEQAEDAEPNSVVVKTFQVPA